MAAVADAKDTGFGQRLRAIRVDKGLTPTELAELVGMAMPNILRLESGGRSPTWVTVLTLADALGVTPDAFLPADPPPRAMGKRK